MLAEEHFYRGQRWCKGCLRSVSGKRLRERRRRAKAFLLDHLLGHPCADCGERDPVVLEFDHLRDKSRTLTELAHEGVRLEVLAAEMAKCEVVCAICHRRRTAGRRTAPTANRPRAAVAAVQAVLRTARCADCGLADPAVLDFDHRGTKRAAVTTLAWRETSLAAVAAEIAGCEIRCANCHRRRTARDGGHYRYVATRQPL